MYLDCDSCFLLRNCVILSMGVVSNKKTEVTFNAEDVYNIFIKNVDIHL